MGFSDIHKIFVLKIVETSHGASAAASTHPRETSISESSVKVTALPVCAACKSPSWVTILATRAVLCEGRAIT